MSSGVDDDTVTQEDSALPSFQSPKTQPILAPEVSLLASLPLTSDNDQFI